MRLPGALRVSTAVGGSRVAPGCGWAQPTPFVQNVIYRLGLPIFLGRDVAGFATFVALEAAFLQDCNALFDHFWVAAQEQMRPLKIQLYVDGLFDGLGAQQRRDATP